MNGLLRIDDAIRLGEDVFNQFVGLTQARLATLSPGSHHLLPPESRAVEVLCARSRAKST